MSKEDLKEKAFDITLGLAVRKYEEELKRNDIINTKAGFLLTVISMRITHFKIDFPCKMLCLALVYTEYGS